MGSDLCCISGESKRNGEDPNLNVPNNSFIPPPTHNPPNSRYSPTSSNPISPKINLTSEKLKFLILDTLKLIRTLLDNSQADMLNLRVLQKYAEEEDNWLTLMLQVVAVVPVQDPLSHVVISVIVEECSVPSIELSAELCRRLKIEKMMVEEENGIKNIDFKLKKVAERKKKGLKKDEMAVDELECDNKNTERGLNEPISDLDLKRRNTCIVLACIAEKMAGPKSVALLTDLILEFLFSNIKTFPTQSVALFSIIALEKFSLTSENKNRIMLLLSVENVLSWMEHQQYSNDMTTRQVAFCCQWSLDNIFVLDDRVLTYTTLYNSHDNNQHKNVQHIENTNQMKEEKVDKTCDNVMVSGGKVVEDDGDGGDGVGGSNDDGRDQAVDHGGQTVCRSGETEVNVILNQHDVSEYLKISADGLEARSDSMSFESVRSTHAVNEGRWYYEVLIVTPGVMQIGWASKNSKFLSQEGFGIGDDCYSIAYDGCRQLIWHNAISSNNQQLCWKAGDVLGSLLDVEKQEVTFTLCDKDHSYNLSCTIPFIIFPDNSYFAAASLMAFQQCRFNFGATPFHHPPSTPFCIPNNFQQLTPQQRIIIPRHEKLKRLQNLSIAEDSCTLCLDNQATVVLLPCLHRGFCSVCSMQLKTCPICRHVILDRSSLP